MQLLLPFDGSDAALQACRLVAGYRGDTARLRITLLNAHRHPVQLWPEAGLNVAVLEQALVREGEATLQTASALLAPAGLSPTTQVRIAAPAEAILEVAREERTDAIVMGTRGHGLLGGYALGSVALRVAPAAPCPVVLTKPGGQLPAAWGQRLRVLAPLDGSEAATQTVRRLLAWRPALGELHVDLAHFAPALPYLAQVLPPHDDVVQSWSGRQAEAAVEAARQLLTDAGVSHEVHRLTGDAAPGIAAFATERGAEAIAMATHGGGLLRHAFGSVALRTAHLSEVPLLLMR